MVVFVYLVGVVGYFDDGLCGDVDVGVGVYVWYLGVVFEIVFGVYVCGSVLVGVYRGNCEVVGNVVLSECGVGVCVVVGV